LNTDNKKKDKSSSSYSSNENKKKNGGFSTDVDDHFNIKKPIIDQSWLSYKLNVLVVYANKIKISPSIETPEATIEESIENLKLKIERSIEN
jgi:hypothetical protein